MFIDPGNQKDFSRYMAMSQVGLGMVAPIGIGALVDYYCSTNPWGVVAGVVCGLVGGLTQLVLLTRKSDEDDVQPPQSPKPGTP